MGKKGKQLVLLITFGILLFVCPGISNAKDPDKQDDFTIALKGYFKTILAASKDIKDNHFAANLNRLRFDIDVGLAETWALEIIYDNDIVFGEILKTPDFALFQRADRGRFLDLDKDIVSTDDVFWQHSLYRAYLKYSGNLFKIVVGRQYIGWGVARFWSPINLFNPSSPLQLERDEIIGIDAIRADIYLGDLSKFQVIYAHQKKAKESSGAVRFQTTIKEYDISVMAGKFGEKKVIGFDFDGNIGNGGLRGEFTFVEDKKITYTTDQNANLVMNEKKYRFIRATIGVDYIFPNNLYIMGEYFYNGGAKDSTLSPNLLQFEDDIITRNKNFLGLSVGYNIALPIRLDCDGLYDIDGKGIYVSPRITFSIRENLDLLVGTQIFTVRKGTEFENLSNIYYIQVQKFF